MATFVHFIFQQVSMVVKVAGGCTCKRMVCTIFPSCWLPRQSPLRGGGCRTASRRSGGGPPWRARGWGAFAFGVWLEGSNMTPPSAYSREWTPPNSRLWSILGVTELPAPPQRPPSGGTWPLEGECADGSEWGVCAANHWPS